MSDRTPARHEVPEIDAAALDAARRVDALIAAASRLPEVRAADGDRWIGYFQPLPDQLRDGSLADIRVAGRRIRAAFGPKDSIRDVVDPTITEPLLDATDRLLKVVARYEAHRH